MATTEPDSEPPMSEELENVEGRDEDEDKVVVTIPSVDVQVMVILRMVLQLAD